MSNPSNRPSKDVVKWRHRPEHGDIIRSAWGDFVRYDDIKHLLPTGETTEAPFGTCAKCKEPITSFHNINGCPAEKANACQCDPNPSIGGSPQCPVHDGESEL